MKAIVNAIIVMKDYLIPNGVLLLEMAKSKNMAKQKISLFLKTQRLSTLKIITLVLV